MKRLLAALLCTPLLALAAEPLTFEITDKDTGQRMLLTLYDKPCESDGASTMFPAHMRPTLRAAVLLWQDKQYASCYLIAGGLVYSADETGDRLSPPLPITMFVSRMI